MSSHFAYLTNVTYPRHSRLFPVLVILILILVILILILVIVVIVRIFIPTDFLRVARLLTDGADSFGALFESFGAVCCSVGIGIADKAFISFLFQTPAVHCIVVICLANRTIFLSLPFAGDAAVPPSVTALSVYGFSNSQTSKSAVRRSGPRWRQSI